MNDDTDNSTILNLFGPNFCIREHRNVNDVFSTFTRTLDSRNVCLDAQRQWRAAWQRFENTSEQYLERIPAIRIDNKDPTKLLKHRTEYKRRAVRNFLPYLRNRLPFLKGQAKQTTRGAIRTLELWKTELHIKLRTPDRISFDAGTVVPEPVRHLSLPDGEPTREDLPRHPESTCVPKVGTPDDFLELMSDDELSFDNWERTINSDATPDGWEKSSFLKAYRDAESDYESNHPRNT